MMATPPITVGTAMATSRFFLASAWGWADSLDVLATVTLCRRAMGLDASSHHHEFHGCHELLLGQGANTTDGSRWRPVLARWKCSA